VDLDFVLVREMLKSTLKSTKMQTLEGENS